MAGLSDAPLLVNRRVSKLWMAVFRASHRSLSSRTFGRQAFSALVLILWIGLACSIIAAVSLGSVSLPFVDVWSTVLRRLTGWSVAPIPLAIDAIVWEIRLPRVLLAAVVGAGLGIVGATIQALVRNPLADPYVLGVSSGASLGAVIVILFGIATFGLYTLSIGAFLGALFSLIVVFALAQQGGHLAPVRLVLAGVAVSYVLSGITSFLVFKAQQRDQIASVLFWLLGSLSSASWDLLLIPTLALILGIGFLMCQARKLNTMLIGEESAISMGTDITRLRRFLFVLTALLTGIMVAVSGGIGFVGLLLPHIVRMIVGTDHRRVLPITLLLGAIFLVWADVLARLIAAPAELPLGIITSLVGAPFFLWLLQQRGRVVRGEKV